MLISYIDESGCTGALPSATAPIQPVFSLLALTLEAEKIPQLTRDFTKLKQKFFPRSGSPVRPLDAILTEVKGADIRREIRQGNRAQKRHHIGLLAKAPNLIEQNQGRIYGRVYVKPIGGIFKGTEVYTSATQSLCQTFEHLLSSENQHGIIIADSRNYNQNRVVAHSIFTEKFRYAGDKYPNIKEMPVFGHSDNHAGIQLCDLLNSAIITPIACLAYCSGAVTNVHVHENYKILQDKLGSQLKSMQYRYQDKTGKWKGGLTVADAIGKKSSSKLFSP